MNRKTCKIIFCLLFFPSICFGGNNFKCFNLDVAEKAESFRKELAIQWWGKEFPDWSSPCLITLINNNEGSGGGATHFIFDNGEVFGWRMNVSFGKDNWNEDSVLKHEIMHTLLASNFREPLPRWFDEGIACSVESEASQKRILNFLPPDEKSCIPLYQLLVMDYSQNMNVTSAFYAESLNFTNYLLTKGTKKQLIDLYSLAKQKTWLGAIKESYGIEERVALQQCCGPQMVPIPCLNPPLPIPNSPQPFNPNPPQPSWDEVRINNLEVKINNFETTLTNIQKQLQIINQNQEIFNQDLKNQNQININQNKININQSKEKVTPCGPESRSVIRDFNILSSMLRGTK